MKLIPLKGYLVIRMQNVKPEGGIELPEGTELEPYGVIVVQPDPTSQFKVGDKVIFRPDNIIAGFDKGGDERFIIPQSCIYAFCDPDSTQDGAEKLTVLPTPDATNN